MPASTEALELLTTVTAGISFEIPVIDLSQPVFEVPGNETSDLYAPIERLEIGVITDGEVTGPGAFDALMRGAKAHLTYEYESGRITGAEYTKAYIAMVELAMTNATQFMLAREATFWEAQRSQIAAITARAGLEQQKLQVALALFDANNAKANYAQTVLSLATTEVEYDTAAYTLTNILPLQLSKLTAENTLLATQNTKMLAEKLLVDAQVDNVQATTNKVGAETTLVGEETLNVTTQRSQITAQTSLLGSQKSMTDAQVLNEPKRGLLLDQERLKLVAETTQVDAQINLLGAQELHVEAQTLNEPKRGVVLDREASKITAETTLLGTQNTKLLADKSFVEAQTGKIAQEVDQIIAQTALLGSQKLNTDAQTLNEPKKGSLLDEQVEAQRAQTLETRTDGVTTVTGVIGKQKALYSQQIISYQRDSEVKAGKLFSDAWITQKTIDEGLTAPSGFTNASLDQVLSKIKTELGMGGI